MFKKHNSIKADVSRCILLWTQQHSESSLPWRHHLMQKGDRRSSGLQNWQAEAPVTGCQFIGHHLVSQDGRDRLNKEKRNRNSRAEGSRWARWISAGNSTSTGTHIQLPHGVAVTSSVHQKAQNQHYRQVWWGHLQGGFGDLCRLERKRNKSQAVTLSLGLDAATSVQDGGVLWPDNFLLPVLLPGVNGIIARTPTAWPKGQGLCR